MLVSTDGIDDIIELKKETSDERALDEIRDGEAVEDVYVEATIVLLMVEEANGMLDSKLEDGVNEPSCIAEVEAYPGGMVSTVDSALEVSSGRATVVESSISLVGIGSTADESGSSAAEAVAVAAVDGPTLASEINTLEDCSPW